MTMTAMPHATEWTVDDLDQLPDDGLQYELIDGVLIVTPAPVVGHQRLVGELYMLLRQACPTDLEVLFAPVDFQPDRRTSVQPDLLALRRGDAGEKNVQRPLLLAVEILSPSTRRKDLLLKPSVYAAAGVASYWIIDPTEPSVIAWDLVDGEYVEAGRAVKGETLALTGPFAVRITPEDLIGR